MAWRTGYLIGDLKVFVRFWFKEFISWDIFSCLILMSTLSPEAATDNSPQQTSKDTKINENHSGVSSNSCHQSKSRIRQVLFFSPLRRCILWSVWLQNILTSSKIQYGRHRSGLGRPTVMVRWTLGSSRCSCFNDLCLYSDSGIVRGSLNYT